MKPLQTLCQWIRGFKPQCLYLGLLMGLMSFSAGAGAPLNAQILHDSAHASLCLSCHSETSLRALPKDVFLEKMFAYQNSPIKDQVMHQMAKGLSQEEIHRMAQYFSSPKGSTHE